MKSNTVKLLEISLKKLTRYIEDYKKGKPQMVTLKDAAYILNKLIEQLEK